jgi:hypothetical protein
LPLRPPHPLRRARSAVVTHRLEKASRPSPAGQNSVRRVGERRERPGGQSGTHFAQVRRRMMQNRLSRLLRPAADRSGARRSR